MHWTQTEEGKRKMALVQKRAWREKKRRRREESRAERAVRKAKAKSARHTTNGHHPMIMINGESVIINGWKITPSGDQLKLEKV